MAKMRYPVLKRSRSLDIEPSVLGYNKTSKRQKIKGRGKISEYALQLKEKQKAKFIYGVLEKQFRRFFKIASKKEGKTGENLLILLERRLDNVLFRLNFARTRAQARQFILHGHVKVNGKKVNIPSFLVKLGDEIAIKENSKIRDTIMYNLGASSAILPEWLELSGERPSGKVKQLPTRQMIEPLINEQLIVELYSK